MTPARSDLAYERIGAAFAHREADRVPLWAIIQNRPVYEYALGPEPVANSVDVGIDDKIRLHAEVYERLGIDMTRAQLWPPDCGLPLDKVSHWAERPITADTLAGYQPHFPDAKARDEDVVIKCRQVEANQPHTVFAPTLRGIFCPTFEKMGLEEFSYAAMDHLVQVERLLEAYTEYTFSMAERLAAQPNIGYVAICDDMAFKGGLIFPPDWMRRHWKPKMAHILSPLKKRGIKVIFHSDGNTESLIPDLIEIGFDAINPLEPLAGMDLGHIKRAFGKDITLIGGVDCAQLLTFECPQKVRDEVKRLLDIGGPGGGFIIGDSSQITPNTPLRNVLAFYETVHGAAQA
jgi:hypothetical protein